MKRYFNFYNSKVISMKRVDYVCISIIIIGKFILLIKIWLEFYIVTSIFRWSKTGLLMDEPNIINIHTKMVSFFSIKHQNENIYTANRHLSLCYHHLLLRNIGIKLELSIFWSIHSQNRNVFSTSFYSYVIIIFLNKLSTITLLLIYWPQ